MLARNAHLATPAHLREAFNVGAKMSQAASELALNGSTGTGKHMQNDASFGYLL